MPALGFDDSLFNIEFFVDADGTAKIVEVNGRMASQFAPLVRAVHGVSTYRIQLELATGGSPTVPEPRTDMVASSFVLRRYVEDAVVASVPDPSAVVERFPGSRSSCWSGRANACRRTMTTRPATVWRWWRCPARTARASSMIGRRRSSCWGSSSGRSTGHPRFADFRLPLRRPRHRSKGWRWQRRRERGSCSSARSSTSARWSIRCPTTRGRPRRRARSGTYARWCITW